MSTRLPKLAAEHPATLKSASHEASISSGIKLAWLSHMLLRIGFNHFGLMSR